MFSKLNKRHEFPKQIHPQINFTLYFKVYLAGIFILNMVIISSLKEVPTYLYVRGKQNILFLNLQIILELKVKGFSIKE